MATGAQHGMEAVQETVYGTTPATPEMTPVRLVSTTLGLSKNTFQSQELRSDRMISDFRHGTKQIAGDIVGELSYSSFDDFLAAVLGGTWTVDNPGIGTDQLKAGVTLPSFTVRRRFTDISEVSVYTGVKFSALSMEISDQISTASFSVIGKDEGLTDIAGATIAAATTTSPFSGLDVGTINEGGAPIADITAISLSLQNSLSPKYALGSPTTKNPTPGRSNLTGTVTAYFEDRTLLNKFVNETESNLDFTLTDLDGNALKFIIPRLKYNGGQPDVSGEGEIVISLPFQALYDVTTGTNFLIERTPV